LQAQDSQALQNVLGNTSASPFGRTPAGTQYSSAQVVLENLQVTAAGKNGGYYYEVYVNLPASIDRQTAQRRYFVGSFGAFEISGLLHHGGSATLTFPATHVLAEIPAQSMNEVTVSIVRVSGRNSPRGTVVTAGEARLELTANGN
jgi:tyrosinase